MSFKSLTKERKLEAEQFHRTNPGGKWMRPPGVVLFDDERLRHGDDRLRAGVQQIMSGVLIVLALVWYWAEVNDWTIHTGTVAKWGWSLAVLSVTLRQAIALWSEEDPRALHEGLELVQVREA